MGNDFDLGEYYAYVTSTDLESLRHTVQIVPKGMTFDVPNLAFAYGKAELVAEAKRMIVEFEKKVAERVAGERGGF